MLMGLFKWLIDLHTFIDMHNMPTMTNEETGVCARILII